MNPDARSFVALALVALAGASFLAGIISVFVLRRGWFTTRRGVVVSTILLAFGGGSLIGVVGLAAPRDGAILLVACATGVAIFIYLLIGLASVARFEREGAKGILGRSTNNGADASGHPAESDR